ncbi:toll/interleukin-1 receptor domain-containing protein [uncultured Thiodictyon sp.]|jgi:hypothetical protein|uniref:toll/interleukin-1 receptor domain-containing protein n=1 Tax=uncultured Thiodictyon sp. TaxID=1846217 RepID=UPI0025F817F7|nr:toll/interleukin-1 receptor domain-containing protein [uncultured Thiodictyon sp.]
MADDTLFDGFLSHNSRDLEAARTLAAVLRDRKLRSWIDREELRAGEPWLDGLAQGLHACRSVAVLVGPQGPGPWQMEETRTALDLAVRGRLRAFAVLLPGAGEAPAIPAFLGNRNWVDLRTGLEDPAGLDRLVWGITGARPVRHAADETPRPSGTPAAPAGVPADPPTLTLLLECRGDQVTVGEQPPQAGPPRTTTLAELRRLLATPNQGSVFRTLFESPAHLANLATAAGGAPADDPTRHPLRLRLLCADPRIGALPWHHLHYQGERLGGQPGWIIEVMERAAGGTLTIALERPLVVAPADPALAISARSHVTLVTAHLARLLGAPRTPVPWAKTERDSGHGCAP